MKGQSEAHIRKALSAIAADGMALMIHKMPDDSRNWKPADFAVWFRNPSGVIPMSAFIEVKQTAAVEVFDIADIRPSQWQGIRQAEMVGTPYYLAIWWTRHKRWTISNAKRLIPTTVSPLRGAPTPEPDPKPTYTRLSSVIGIDCTTVELTMMLKAVLLGETD